MLGIRRPQPQQGETRPRCAPSLRNRGAKAWGEMPARDEGGLSRLEGVIFIKAHVQGRNGVPGSVSAFDAYLGFRDMGFEVVASTIRQACKARRGKMSSSASESFALGCASSAPTTQASITPKNLRRISTAGFGAARSTR